VDEQQKRNFIMQAKSVSALLIAAAMIVSVGLSACNTVEGAGKDVSAAGSAVSDTAKDVKQGN
jgi:predicted small secreted protein